MYSCTECPASKPEYLKQNFAQSKCGHFKATCIEWDTDGEDIALPTEIDIPDGMTDEDEISDYLSDQTGFCHMGFRLEHVRE